MRRKSYNWPLYVTLLIAFYCFFFAIGNMVTPEMYRKMSPPELGYVFVPDDDTFAGTDFYLQLDFIKFGPEAPQKAVAHLSESRTGTNFQDVEFEPVTIGGVTQNRWLALLPTLNEKGSRWFYYITIETTQGREIEIRKKMNWFERLIGGFNKYEQLFWVTYEGNVVRDLKGGKFLLISHIVLSLGALFFIFHTIYYSLQLIKSPNSLTFIKSFNSAFWAWLSFTIGTIAIGIPITKATFNIGFEPWPTRGLTDLGDITDTKSLFLSVWWIVLILSNMFYYFEARVGNLATAPMKKFAIGTFIALIITILVFMIPHSQFL